MNRYLLIEGDCRKVLLYIKPESIQQIITSPPYFMIAKYGGLQGEIGSRGTLEQYIKDLTEVFQQLYRVLKPNGTFMLNIDSARREAGLLSFSAWEFIPILKQVGFQLTQTIIWVDRGRRQLFHPRLLDHHYEPIFVLAKGNDYFLHQERVWGHDEKGRYVEKQATLPQGDVWEISGCYLFQETEDEKLDTWDKSGVATFPVELVTHLIKLGSNPNDTVLDPFLGSGTVMDVAQRTTRNAIGVEINMDYCQRVMKRCFNQGNTYRYITQGELERGNAKF